MNKVKIGIVGAAGFIGKNLVRYLNLHSSFEIITAQRTVFESPEQTQNFLKEVEAVIYLAHQGGPNQQIPLTDDLERNLGPLRHFLAELKSAKKKIPLKIIYLSSGGAIYGISKNKALWKESDPLQPVSNYGKVKLEAEKCLKEASSEGFCTVVCLRPGNPYGNYFDHEKLHGVIDVIISRLISESTFTLYDSLDTVRDYLHLNDLNRAILSALTFSTKNFEVLNVGTGTGTSLREMIQMIESISKMKLEVNVKATLPGVQLVPWSVIDVSKIKTILHWVPSTSLENGLTELIQRKIAIKKSTT